MTFDTEQHPKLKNTVTPNKNKTSSFKFTRSKKYRQIYDAVNVTV